MQMLERNAHPESAVVDVTKQTANFCPILASAHRQGVDEVLPLVQQEEQACGC